MDVETPWSGKATTSSAEETDCYWVVAVKVVRIMNLLASMVTIGTAASQVEVLDDRIRELVWWYAHVWRFCLRCFYLYSMVRRMQDASSPTCVVKDRARRR